MSWLSRIFGRREHQELLQAREEDIPGHGRVRIAYVVNCIGAMCPRPQLLTLKILGLVREGEVIEIVSDNPAAVESFPALAESMFCTHLLTLKDDDCWRLYLRKGLAAQVATDVVMLTGDR